MKQSELRKIIREVILESFSAKPVPDELALLVAKKLGVEDEVDMEQFRKGMEVEQEHTRSIGGFDPMMLGKITLDHLRELPDYYTRLDKMETEVSTSDATPGYQIPRAFQGSSPGNKRRRHANARTSGMKIIEPDEEDDVDEL